MFGELADAITTVLETDLDGLSDAELYAAVAAVMAAEPRLAAARAAVVGAWDVRGGWADDGSLSAAARLARDLGVSERFARREVFRARRLREMPVANEALRAGVISVDHVDRLAAVRIPELADAFARGEQMLVDWAVRLSFRQFQQCVTHWKNRADDTRAARDAAHRHNTRFLDVARTFAGCVDVRGVLAPVDGGIVLDELTRLEQGLFQTDWAAARAEHGDRACLDDVGRTAKQRRADALVEMARRSAAMTVDHVMVRPLITVLVDYPTFHGAVCELADGTVITPAEIRPLLTDADVERVVFDGPARVIEVGAKQRFFTGGLRRAIEVRDRHCTHPGCAIGSERCQVDHIIEHVNGGLTTQDNGRLLCPAHHRQRGRPIRGPSP